MTLRSSIWAEDIRLLTYHSSRSKYLNLLLNIFTIFLFLIVRNMMLFHINIVDIIHIIFDWFDGIAIVFDWLNEIAI